MRKVSLQAAAALRLGHEITLSNTVVGNNNLFLHGNLIASISHFADYRASRTLSITLAGWNTSTTRERLNTLLSVFGIPGRFSTKLGQPLFDGKPISDTSVLRFSI